MPEHIFATELPPDLAKRWVKNRTRFELQWGVGASGYRAHLLSAEALFLTPRSLFFLRLRERLRTPMTAI